MIIEMDEYYYIIYRLYDDLSPFYGWTMDKNIMKAFFQQRDPKKYKKIKIYKEDMKGSPMDDKLTSDKMISILKLGSVQLREKIPIFMTMSELNEVEIEIQAMFRSLCSLADNATVTEREIMLYVQMITHLEDDYAGALHYIGYRPPEVDILYDSPFGESVEDQIDIAYEGLYNILNCRESYNIPLDQVPGTACIEDFSKKIIYSLESFVRIMKDNFRG